ncbi:MAG: hypothetical protein MJ154_03100 [Candidatus Saccharibacteria bacterium]|nr:hypothetical protein [Candidatus Saccharibacteria bacterium]
MEERTNKLAPENTSQNDPYGYDVDYDGHMPPEIIDSVTRGPAIVLAILFSMIIGVIAAGFVLIKGILWILELVR